ncbi:HesB/YadR/YfhF family protein [Evansella cellulosilytica]|uniref:HesB/YadR/YfhF-family protein n=1 Tax=Evansella cellulosilytica (strain ATCC 21833 / DSM 2522 / FERM P-1141 / JCM 9156 / N-4) TaxID=649639 RepID=E6TXX4_EVAC2|nr:HesB/YadR/YfhF family protein [Evansella cellulosilytica]ADU31187.1 HesB/YadR/YfhF-family protein [Evansella cellulosilytica DSM 2522]
MNIKVTDEAYKWFSEELGVTDGDHVQFFVRYGGCGDFQTGFSLGVSVKEPEEAAVSHVKNGVTFYIEKKDEWYFDDHDLLVQFDDTIDEIKYLHDSNN